MDNKNKATIIASLALMAVIGAGTIGMGIIANAHPSNSNEQNRRWSSSSQVFKLHNQIEDAINNNDYKSWKNAIEDRIRPVDVVTEKNFPQFVKMHNLMKQGQYEEAQKIRDELGISGVGGSRVGRAFRGVNKGFHRGENLHGNFRDENSDDICDNMQ